MTDKAAYEPMWHAEVATQVEWQDAVAEWRAVRSVSFAEPTLPLLLARIERECPDHYGFAVYRDDCGFIYPSALYQRFVEVDANGAAVK